MVDPCGLEAFLNLIEDGDEDIEQHLMGRWVFLICNVSLHQMPKTLWPLKPFDRILRIPSLRTQPDKR